MRVLSLFLLFSLALAHAQTEPGEQLQEILLKGNFAASVNPGYAIQVVADSILISDYKSLGELLQQQANLYFKQNGYGMVSSISLRGTTAAQTGVFWNGIAINSVLNGQTDFNALQANSFNEIEIRRGGGSVLLGSGAVGGAVNLSDRIEFSGRIPGESEEGGHGSDYHLMLGAGSYATFKGQLTGRVSTEDLFAKVSFGAFGSRNDFPFQGTELKNQNGEISNYNANLVLGYRLGDRDQLALYGTLFNNDRNLSRTLTAESNEKLKNFDSRLLAEWKHLGDRFTSSLKVAYLSEDYTYFFDQDRPENRSDGAGDRWIGKYDIAYYLRENIVLKGGVEFENARARGSSLEEVQRNDFTAYGLFQHRPADRFVYNLSLRGGSSTAYEVPFIFSADGAFSLSESLKIRGGYSSNYRLPSFNDLYWEPGGNPDLDPESSHSGELGLSFDHGSQSLSVTGFLISSKDLIQWQPEPGGIWSPVNVRESRNYGVEIALEGSKRFHAHGLSWNLRYDYTRATDEVSETQLIYVPEHKANGLLGYLWKTWSASYQVQYTGEVFTTTSNTQKLDDYAISNLELSKFFLEGSIQVRFQVNNLFDKTYESVAYRPMPDRNYHFNLNFTF
jgi:iron complex outermembrane receptor protein